MTRRRSGSRFFQHGLYPPGVAQLGVRTCKSCDLNGMPNHSFFISAWFPLRHSIQHLPINRGVPELKSSKMQAMTRNCYHLYLPFHSPIPRCGCYSTTMLKKHFQKAPWHKSTCALLSIIYAHRQKSLKQLQPSKMPFWAEEFLPNHWTGINISSSSGVRESVRTILSWERWSIFPWKNNITGSFFPLTDSTTTPHQIITIKQSWLMEQLFIPSLKLQMLPLQSNCLLKSTGNSFYFSFYEKKNQKINRKKLTCEFTSMTMQSSFCCRQCYLH